MGAPNGVNLMRTLAVLLVLLSGCASAPASEVEPSEPLIADGFDGELRAYMTEVGRQARRTIWVDDDVATEFIRVSIASPMPWREVVEIVARMTDCEVLEEAGGVLRLSLKRVFLVTDAGGDAQAVIMRIAKQSRRNVVLPGKFPTVPVDGFEALPWRDALAKVLKQVDRQWTFVEEDRGRLVRVVKR